MIALYFCHDNNWTNLFYRGARVWWSSGLHPGSIWSKEQIDDQRDLLSHDMRHWHHQHPIRLRRCYWRYHRQQPSRMRSLLKWTQIPFSHKSKKNTQAKKKMKTITYIYLYLGHLFFFSSSQPPMSVPARNRTRKHTHTRCILLNWFSSFTAKLPTASIRLWQKKGGAHSVQFFGILLISISFSCAKTTHHHHTSTKLTKDWQNGFINFILF